MLSINYQCTLCHVCVTQYIFCNSPVDEDTRKGGCTLAGVAGLGLDDSGLIWSNSMATPSRDTTSGVFIILEKVVLNKPFLAHQSTKCSGWAIVTGFCSSSINIFSLSEHKSSDWAIVSGLCPSSNKRVLTFLIQTTSSLKLLIGFWPNLALMIPGWPST